MNLKEKKLIIFDLDGTLIDSGPDLALSLNAMLKELGHKEFSEDTIHAWVGNGALTLVTRALSGSVEIDTTLKSSYVERALEIFLEHYKKNLCVKTQLYPNVKKTLQRLHKSKYTLAIVTNKPTAFVPEILEKLEIAAYFSLILGGDSLSEKKPSPLPLLHTCKELGFEREEAVMVGDSKNDILAANAASIESIAVNYGYNYGEDIRISKPTALIDDFGEILNL